MSKASVAPRTGFLEHLGRTVAESSAIFGHIRHFHTFPMNSSLFEGCWKVCAVFPKGNAQFCTVLEKCLKVVGNFFALVLHWPHQNVFQQNWFHAGIYTSALQKFFASARTFAQFCAS